MASHVIEQLATRFPSLYVVPREGAADEWRRAALEGVIPEGATLDHFLGSDADSLSAEDTPAGPVEALFLRQRADFECFIRCTVRRGEPQPIAPSIGASTIQGLPDWSKIRDEALRAVMAGEDVSAALKAFIAEKRHLTTLVLVSWGPYSALSFERTPFAHDEWLDVSLKIRTFHELAHVVCRRLLPSLRHAVYDEVCADFNGLLRATGTYDDSLAADLLGVSEQGYVGGRLEEYLDEGQRADVDVVAREVRAICAEIAHRYANARPDESFEHTLELMRAGLLAY